MKTEAPSEEKIQALRDEGIVPMSLLASHAVAVAVSVVVFNWALSEFDFSFWSQCLTPRECSALLPTARDALFSLFLLPALSYAGAYFATTLAQTRGLLRIGMIRSSWPRANNNSLVLVVFGWMAAIAATWVLAIRLPRRLVEFTNSATPESWKLIEEEVASVVFLFAGALIGFALLAWFFARLLFFREHRMTREEVARQLR